MSMKYFKTFFLSAVCFFIISAPAAISQTRNEFNTNAPVTLHRAEVIKIKSSSNGVTYPINVALPGSYFVSGKAYPVVYMLDAYSSFGMVTEMARLLASSRELPEIILVGISSEGGSKEFVFNRSRDYTPTQIRTEKLPQELRSAIPVSGGAEKFLKFIKEELIPFVETKYRTAPGDRTLAGHSLGGLFVFYSLFAQPELFKRYVAISPALVWDDEWVLKNEEVFFADHKSINAALYTSVGSKEEQSFISSWKKLTAEIQRRNYSLLKLKTETAADETHYTIMPQIITHGLKSVFEMMPVEN